MEEISLYRHAVRDSSEPITMLLKYLRVPFRLLPPQDFASSFPFCSFPAIRDNTSGLELSDTAAICRYLAGKYRPKMLGSAMNEFAELDALLCLAVDAYRVVGKGMGKSEEHVKGGENGKESFNGEANGLKEAQCETASTECNQEEAREETKNDNVEKGSDEEKKEQMKLDEKTKSWVMEKLSYVEKLLKGRNWLVGKQPSIADFFFVELMNLLDWIDGRIKDKFARIRNLVRKFYLIPEMAAHRETQSSFGKETVCALRSMS